MLKLIINADDFGLSQNVNDAIIESYRKGILRSASLMANGKSFEHAVSCIKSNTDLDIGIHLTLTEQKPILDSFKVASLVDEKGYLPEHAIEFSMKYILGKISHREIQKEISAQFEKILDNGIKISHIDSHQHLHLLPQILNWTNQMAKHYNIKFIRLPKENLSSYMLNIPNSPSRIVQMIILNYLCLRAKNQKINRSDYFAGYYLGGKLNKKNLITVINNLPSAGTCELMCHPGSNDLSRKRFFSYYRKENELAALMDDEVKETLVKKNIQLISFSEL